MICKWCGETIKTGARTCRRCKREVPALSDCGGFYDLVSKDTPVQPSASDYQPAVQPPVRPVITQPKRINPLFQIALGLAVVLALIFMILSISLSGKLADAREEADRLRSQNKSKEPTSESQPSTPDINGLGNKDPESTDEPEEISIILEANVGEIALDETQNAQLNTGILHFCVCRDGEAEPALTFTIQRRPAAEETEELYLQITDAGAWAVHSVEWRSSSLIELPIDGIDGLLPSQPDAPAEPVTEFSQPIESMGEGANICVLTGLDENGEELTITILNIVIE